MKTTILATLVLSFTLSAFAGDNIFVDANKGNDQNPGTQFAPFKTIQAALFKAQAGDFIAVESGIYNERLSFPRTGKDWGGQIHVSSNHKGLAIIDGTGMGIDRPLIDLSKRKFITFSNFTIRNSQSEPAVRISGSENINFSGNTILNSKAGVVVDDSKEIVIKDNEISGIKGDGLVVTSTSTSMNVAYNTVVKSGGGIKIESRSGIFTDYKEKNHPEVRDLETKPLQKKISAKKKR